MRGEIAGECFVPARGVAARRFLFALLLALAAFFATAHASCLALALLTRHQVTVHFATTRGVPMANAPVRVFTPGNAREPVVTGRTDAEGNFTFLADKSGFWSAEAASGGEIARVMVRVGAGGPERGFLAPRVLLAGLVLLLIAFGYGIVRWRRRP